MTILTSTQRKQVARNWIDENFVKADEIAVQHGGDVYAAVGDIDDLIETQQAALNAALPEPFKSTATASQKASLFAEVMLARYNG